MMGRREIMAAEQDDRYRGYPHHRKHREKTAPMKSVGERRLPAHPASVVQCDHGNMMTLAEINLPLR
jgi:hypothetical protein